MVDENNYGVNYCDCDNNDPVEIKFECDDGITFVRDHGIISS